MPDLATPWPYGLAERGRVLQWGNQAKPFQIKHDLTTIVEAVQIPIAVIVGTGDTAFLSNKPQQGGTNRFVRGQRYVAMMRRFAVSNNVNSNIEFVPVKRVGHDSSGLTAMAEKALMVMGQQNAAQRKPVADEK